MNLFRHGFTSSLSTDNSDLLGPSDKNKEGSIQPSEAGFDLSSLRVAVMPFTTIANSWLPGA